jgi:hypothetical protein
MTKFQRHIEPTAFVLNRTFKESQLQQNTLYDHKVTQRSKH